jgi:predicted dehydrogenase
LSRNRRDATVLIAVFGGQAVAAGAEVDSVPRVVVKQKDGGDWENIQTHRPYVGGPYRGLGMAEMAAAILTNRPHRASGERANHVLDIMEGLVHSSQEDRPIDMTTPYEKPEIFADGLEEGEIDHLSA